jgi:hypothetical protein
LSPSTFLPYYFLIKDANFSISSTTPEYGNLRRTCKHIEDTLYTSFAREFFTKRQFILTEFSLQALVDISKSRFSSSLKHVIFGLERPLLLQSPSGQHAKKNRARQEYIGHMSLLYTNRDGEMLAETFSNLRNLETVGIRDFYSHSRNRDYPHNAWKSKLPFCLGPAFFIKEKKHNSWPMDNLRAWSKLLIEMFSRLRCFDI